MLQKRTVFDVMHQSFNAFRDLPVIGFGNCILFCNELLVIPNVVPTLMLIFVFTFLFLHVKTE